MITQPNTLGLFESKIHQITEMCHAKGVQVYMDGANFNAILGITRPGDLGFDVCHFNLHKTFTTPHGGGGPGSGPVGIKAHLAPFLPTPVVVKRPDPSVDGYALDWSRPQSIGKLQAFWGNFGMLVRAYSYIRTMGPDGLRSVSENAVLNANYILKRLEGDYDRSAPGPCMHECVLSARRQKKLGVTAIELMPAGGRRERWPTPISGAPGRGAGLPLRPPAAARQARPQPTTAADGRAPPRRALVAPADRLATAPRSS